MAVRRAAPVDERALLAEYPFLPGAEALVQEFSPSLGELLTDPSLGRARELGRARVRAAADDPSVSGGVAELVHATPEERFLSFLFARLLLSAAPTAAPIRRWAVAEAKLSWNRLRSVSPEELCEVAHRLEYSLTPSGSQVAIRLPDYLRLAAPIREGEFRLVRQDVGRGEVLVGRDRAARLLQEGIRTRLAQPLPVADDVRGAFREREAEFYDDLAQRMPTPTARPGSGVGPLLPDRFPPCIRKMRRMLNESENLSHAGRFALAAFLNRAGADGETIVDAYRGAPDFDEAITRYQVEHITQRAGGLGYEPPECATLRAHGLCFRDGDPTAKEKVDRERDERCFAESLKHPLQYYRQRGGTVVDRRERDPSVAP
jgi:DNA primase large subunit